MATKSEVAVKEDKALALVGENLPDFMKAQKPSQGSDNFDSSDVVVPRIKLLQGLSPEIQSFNDAKIGTFWHTGMDIPLGESFDFIIADRRKKYLLAAPIEDGQGVLARADDAVNWDRTGKWNVKIKGVKNPVTWEINSLNVVQSGLANWGTYNSEDSDSPPAATLFYDYLVFMPKHLELGPAIVSLARSSIRQAKKGLNDKIQLQMQNGRPMQGLVFSASSIDDAADGQSFKNWMFRSAGFVQDKDLYEMVMSHVGALATVQIKDEADVGQPTPGAKVADDGKSGGF